jgi:hypothetical protein
MSVAGISSVSFSPYMQGPSGAQGPSGSNTTTNRQSEDVAARQLIADLEKGDLSGAQQAYNTLASFGPNNSGPWAAGSQMQQEFQQLGQDLSAGNLTGAKGDAKTMAATQLSNDMQIAQQDYKSGDMGAYNQAVENYKGDYWAVFGTTPGGELPITGGGGSPNISQSGLNVTA